MRQWPKAYKPPRERRPIIIGPDGRAVPISGETPPGSESGLESGIFAISGATADFTRVMQAVAVFDIPYCSNEYTLNGIRNQISYSDQFATPPWTKTDNLIQIFSDLGIAPDGKQHADEIVVVSGAGKYIRQDIDTGSAIANRTFTLSIHLRAKEIINPAVVGLARLKILDTGDANGGAADRQYRVADGWVRMSVTITMGAGATGNTLRCSIIPENVSTFGIKIYAWGSQLVEHAKPLRYQANPNVVAWNEGSITTTCEAIDFGDGKRCFFSFPTCPDLPHFDGQDDSFRNPLPSIRKWAFCMKSGYLLKPTQLPSSITSIRPYILDVDFLSQKIDPKRSVTESARINLTMHDDHNPGVLDTDKILFNTSKTGSFWRMWIERYRNFIHRRCEIWLVPRGKTLLNVDESYRVFTGIVEDVEQDTRGRFNLIIKDLLKKARDKSPAAISSENILLTAMDATTTQIEVVNAREFTKQASIPAVANVQRTKVAIRILPEGEDPEDAKEEIMVITAANDNSDQLTLARGAYGTVAVPHTAGAQMREIIVYREDNVKQRGFNPLDIEIDQLLRAGIGVDETTNEFNGEIDVDSFTDDRDTWIPSHTMSRIIEQPEDIEKMLREIRQLIFSNVWVNENQQVQQKLLAPASVRADLIPVLNDASNFVKTSTSVKLMDIDRINRVIVFFDPLDFESSGDKDVKSFHQVAAAEDLFATDPRNFGKSREPLTIFTKWFTDADRESVFFFAKKMLTVFKNGLPQVKFDIDFKDSFIEVGDFINLNTRELVDAHGNKTDIEVLITEKKRVNLGRFRLTSLSLKGKAKYGLIAPAGTPDYTSATSEQRRKYVFIGDANNRVGNGSTEGYKAW